MTTGCARPLAGSVVEPPADLYSRNGALEVQLNYQTSVDSEGRTLFCFVTRDGLESPTLHVKPGEALDITLTNRTPPPTGARGKMVMGVGSNLCGAAMADASSVNLHFHGTNIPPTCHADDVIHTSVNAGQSFTYHLTIPRDQTPGLYWYHPHIHGMTEAAVLGGAAGAIVVDGIEGLQPIVAGLPQRVLIVRDQVVAGAPKPGGAVPSWDVSVNYVPISWPTLTPAIITLRPARKEFWRVLNASADTVVDLHLNYDGVDQPLQVVGLDGVPTGSDNGTRRGHAIAMTHILVPAGGRAELVVVAPTAKVKQALLQTRSIDTGPDGDTETARTLALLSPDDAAPVGGLAPPLAGSPPRAPAAASLETARITAHRSLFFSEVGSDDNAASPTQFSITVEGERPKPYSPTDPPAIVTVQGAVEEWTIQNQARETHEFHIHGVHFKLMKRDGVAVPPDEQQYLDTVADSLLAQRRALPEHYGTRGFPRCGERRPTLSLPYPAT